MASWPTSDDYSTAIQNPQNCFADPELKAGQPVLTAMELPKPASGNFGVVFQMRCNGRTYAVKCFTREMPEQQRRYTALSQHLAGRGVSLLVGFSHLDRGILVQGLHRPVVKMEWATGDLLPRYIGAQLRQVAPLRQLADAWRNAVAELRRNQVAHGDLQCGNILIAQGQIRLVDYDGMYVPSLHGTPPEEIGHRHFQHPKRGQRDYNADVDNFSALVIYLSLIAIAAEPKLWGDFNQGDDEKLIIGESDLQAPGNTALWRRLKGSPDTEVRRLSELLRSFCRGAVSGIPPLDAALANQSTSPIDWAGVAAAYGMSSQASLQPAATVVCKMGHPIRNPGILRTCPECAGRGLTTALFGWNQAPCGHRIPDRASFCPQCGQSTGW